jgi:hypothetical protein
MELKDVVLEGVKLTYIKQKRVQLQTLLDMVMKE